MNINELTEALLSETRAQGKFSPFAHYDPDGDCIEFMVSQEPYKAVRLDKWVTAYVSRGNGSQEGELVGSLIKNVHQLIREFPGLDIDIHDGKILLAHVLRAPAYRSTDPVAKRAYKAAIKVAEEQNMDSDFVVQPC